MGRPSGRAGARRAAAPGLRSPSGRPGAPPRAQPTLASHRRPCRAQPQRAFPLRGIDPALKPRVPFRRDRSRLKRNNVSESSCVSPRRIFWRGPVTFRDLTPPLRARVRNSRAAQAKTWNRSGDVDVARRGVTECTRASRQEFSIDMGKQSPDAKRDFFNARNSSVVDQDFSRMS